MGVLVTGASQTFWDPLLIFTAVKTRATSNLVHNEGSVNSMPKTTFGTKIGGGVD